MITLRQYNGGGRLGRQAVLLDDPAIGQSFTKCFGGVYGSNSPKREFTAFKWEILPLKMRSNGRQKCNLKSVKGYSPTS